MAFGFNILKAVEIFPFVPRRNVRVPGTEAAWRAVHTGSIMNGLLAISTAAIGPMIRLGPRAQRGLVASLVVTVWGNVIGYNAAALSGDRGLRFAGRRLNRVAYCSFLSAAVAVFLAIPLVIVGLLRHRREQTNTAGLSPEATPASGDRRPAQGQPGWV
jgi:hypothetical protein